MDPLCSFLGRICPLIPKGSQWLGLGLEILESLCRSGSTHRLHSCAHDEAVFLYAFDLLELNSEDYRQHPLDRRKAKLEKLLARTQGMRFSEHMDGDGETIFNHACKMGLEDIVLKRRDFPYRSGRCKSSVKINPGLAAVLRICHQGR